MAKRGAEAQSSRTGAFNGGGTDKSGEESDTPQRATAAQLAKRKMATGRKPGRVPAAVPVQSQGAGFGQQQQQQQSHAPFGNVDPNVANGTSNQQNPLFTSTTTNSIIDPHSSTFNLREYNFATNVPGYVPRPGTPGGSGFDFNPNSGMLSTRNPFSPVVNDCALPSDGGGTMIGYAGSLFSMPSTTPAKALDAPAVPQPKEARNYRCDPNLNKNNEGKLWASHSPFLQNQADQTPDNSKSIFTDALKKKEALSNPFSQFVPQPQQQQQQPQLQSSFSGGSHQSFGQQHQQQQPQQPSQSFMTNFQPQQQSSFFGGPNQSFGQQDQQQQQQQQQQQPQQSVLPSFGQPQQQSSFFGGLNQSFQQQQEPQQQLSSQAYFDNMPVDAGEYHMNYSQTPATTSQDIESTHMSDEGEDNTPRPSTSQYNESTHMSDEGEDDAPRPSASQYNESTHMSDEGEDDAPRPSASQYNESTHMSDEGEDDAPRPSASQYNDSTHMSDEGEDDAPRPAPTNETLFKPLFSPYTASQNIQSTHMTNRDGYNTPRPASTSGTAFKPLFPTSTKFQTSIFSTGSKAAPSSKSGGFVPPSNSAPIASASQSGGFKFSFQSAPTAASSQSGGFDPPSTGAPIANESQSGGFKFSSKSAPIAASSQSGGFVPPSNSAPTANPSQSGGFKFSSKSAPIAASSQSGGFVPPSNSAPIANPSQSGGFVFSFNSAPIAASSPNSGSFPSLNSAPIAKTANMAPGTQSGSGKNSSASQQMETLMPPTCPSNFSETQKREYITHYRIRSLNHAFKKHIDSALIFPVDAGVLGFYQAKMDLILLDGSLSLQHTGSKRKWLGDAYDDNESGLNKRVFTNGTLTNGDSPLTTSSNINKSKRKATEEISKDSDRIASSDTTKKARGDLSYPTLPQITETSRLFAKAADDDASSSASAPAPAPAPATESTLNVESTASQRTSVAPSKPSASLFTNTPGPNRVNNAVVPGQSSTFKVPSFGTPSGTNFMSQFGQSAKKTEEEMAKAAKAKRKADEYDSDDSGDDEAAWERKYDEEQRAKKQKIEEAKTNTTFKFVPNKAPGDTTKHTGSAPASSRPATAASASSNISDPGSVLQTPSASHWENPWANLKPQDKDEAQGDEQSVSSDEDEPEAQASKIEAALTSDASSTSAPRSLFDRTETNSDGSLKRAVPTLSVNKQNDTPRSVGIFGQPSTFQSTSPSTPTAPRSGLFGQPFPNSQTTGLFGTASDGSPNPKTALASPQLNNTWSNNSPIKFGGASTAPNLSFTSPSPAKPTEKEENSSPFTTLFGAKPASNSFGGQSATFGASFSSTPSTNTGSIFATSPKTSPPVPVVGFQFGGPSKPFSSLAAPLSFNSATSSRATSPGISTGGESAVEGDEQDGPADTQIDLASARAGEENEDCLLEVKAQSLEMQDKKWIKRGVGPLRILKNRSTGRVRIVHRVETVGKIILNVALMEGMTYNHATDKTVNFGVATGTGSINQWTIRVGLKEKAAELASLLEENKSNR